MDQRGEVSADGRGARAGLLDQTQGRFPHVRQPVRIDGAGTDPHHVRRVAEVGELLVEDLQPAVAGTGGVGEGLGARPQQVGGAGAIRSRARSNGAHFSGSPLYQHSVIRVNRASTRASSEAS